MHGSIEARVFRLCAAGFVLAGLYHATALFHPEWVEPAPPWRHALFVAINAAVAAGFLFRPRFFVYVFALLAAQQLWGHATYGAAVWRTQHRIDWASVIVVLAMPILLGLLVRDARPHCSASSR